jgi:hypothetical protein
MPESMEELLAFREELKVDIVNLLEETESDFALDDVLAAIYEEEETDDMQSVIMMFDDGDPSNLSNVVELVTDAWNCFPHRILDGLSPAEILLKQQA